MNIFFDCSKAVFFFFFFFFFFFVCLLFLRTPFCYHIYNGARRVIALVNHILWGLCLANNINLALSWMDSFQNHSVTQKQNQEFFAKLAGAVEYTNCFSAEG